MRYSMFIIISLFVIISCSQKKDTRTENPIVDKNISKEHTDSLLKEKLELLSVEDQTLRFLLPDVLTKFGRDSGEYNYIWSLIHRQDSLCLNDLVDILDTHGWVSKSRVGSNANQAIWLIIQHADLKIQEKYLPLLRQSVAAGESEGWHLAFLEDRILMTKGQKQIYGTQALWDDALGKNKIYKIQDVKSVDERRTKLGLESIEDYAKSNGHVFDQM